MVSRAPQPSGPCSVLAAQYRTPPPIWTGNLPSLRSFSTGDQDAPFMAVPIESRFMFSPNVHASLVEKDTNG